MRISGKPERKASPTSTGIDIAIRLGVLAVLLAYCFQILRPFISPGIWGIIIAVALYPVYEKLNVKLGERRKLTAAVMTLSALLILILPGVQLAVSSVDTLKTLSTKLEEKDLKVPPPPERVGNWPVIGKSVKNLWQMASDNLESILMKFKSQVFGFSKWLLKIVFGTAVGLLMFAISLVIAGVLMASAKSGGQVAKKLFVRLAGERGPEFAEISTKTVRNVVKGIIGVSLLQSILAGLGFAVAGIPGAGLWALLCLFLAIIQIGIGPAIIPVIIYAFLKMSTLTAVILTVWLVLVALSDGPLKAVLLGRGASVPMLVIFLGAIGGFISFGFLGLFIGSVILSVGYKLLEVWLQEDTQSVPVVETSGPTD
ncbi:MAG: AI-2E family transporter [Desulfobacterales bacterium]|jgi:predicted PurR-regulated permease PerM